MKVDSKPFLIHKAFKKHSGKKKIEQIKNNKNNNIWTFGFFVFSFCPSFLFTVILLCNVTRAEVYVLHLLLMLWVLPWWQIKFKCFWKFCLLLSDQGKCSKVGPGFHLRTEEWYSQSCWRGTWKGYIFVCFVWFRIKVQTLWLLVPFLYT